jgi:hypothetical protein
VAINQVSPLSETARPTLNQSQGKYFLGSNMRKNSLRQEAKRYLTSDHRGSPRARKFRYHVIMQMIDNLFSISEMPSNWKALNNQHIEQLVKRWQKQKIKASTILNHLTVIRKFIQHVGNTQITINNQSLGINRKIKVQKPLKITHCFWQAIPEPLTRILLALQTHFGLTLSEAMRIIPDIHVHQNKLWLTREITFNSLDRTVPYRNDVQKDILKDLIQITKGERNLMQVHGSEAIRFILHYNLRQLKLPIAKSWRFLYAKHLFEELSPILDHYLLNLLIMDEMGIKSRTSLWMYLNEQ